MIGTIITYKEMCISENVKSLQKGMNFRLNPGYSVILMSQRKNAQYSDDVKKSNIIIYEGHDIPAHTRGVDPKLVDQPYYTKKGKLTENGKFALAAYLFKMGKRNKENVKIYEKLYSGVWLYRGLFTLEDYEYAEQQERRVFKFILKPYSKKNKPNLKKRHTRYIPAEVKKKVWLRDKGKCVLCGSKTNLHFDHELPYSKGGSSYTEKNVRILCEICNLKKSNKIE